MNPKIIDAVGFISRFVSDNWDSMADSTEVRDELSNQGFSSKEIADAFKWIEANTLGADSVAQEVEVRPPMRVLTSNEKAKLTSLAQGLLMNLYDRNLIDALILEEILERVQKSEMDEVDDKEIRRITAMTLLTRIQQDWLDLLHSTNTLIH